MVTFSDRQGSLDPHLELTESLEGLLRQPLTGLLVRLLSRVDLHPRDPPLALIGLGDGCVDDGLRGTPDVGTDPVSLDERDDRLGRYDRLATFYRDPLAIRRDGGVAVFGHGTLRCNVVRCRIRQAQPCRKGPFGARKIPRSWGRRH